MVWTGASRALCSLARSATLSTNPRDRPDAAFRCGRTQWLPGSCVWAIFEYTTTWKRTRRTSADPRDGVFVPSESSELEFHALHSLSNADFAELLQTIVARVLAFLEKRGVIESRHDPRPIASSMDTHESPIVTSAALTMAGE